MDNFLITLDEVDEAAEGLAIEAKKYLKTMLVAVKAVEDIATTDHPDEAQEMAQAALKEIKSFHDVG